MEAWANREESEIPIRRNTHTDSQLEVHSDSKCGGTLCREQTCHHLSCCYALCVVDCLFYSPVAVGAITYGILTDQSLRLRNLLFGGKFERSGDTTFVKLLHWSTCVRVSVDAKTIISRGIYCLSVQKEQACSGSFCLTHLSLQVQVLQFWNHLSHCLRFAQLRPD